MKRHTIFICLCFLILFLIPLVGPAQAQSEIEITEVTQEMLTTEPYLQLLLHNWLNLFPISAYKNDFKVKQPEQKLYHPAGNLSTQVDNEVQFVTLSLVPDGVTEHDGMIRLQGAGNLDTFYLTMKVNPTLIEPVRYGG